MDNVNNEHIFGGYFLKGWNGIRFEMQLTFSDQDYKLCTYIV